MENDSTPLENSAPLAASKEERTWAMVAHLSALAGYLIPLFNIVGPLIVWLIKKDTMPLVDNQGKEALNFQITITIAAAISVALMPVLIGFVLLPIVGLFSLIFTIVAGVKANDGVAYRYPATLRLIK